MSWYYATKAKTQAGPVDEATFQSLVQAGEISAETLVWKQGMANWMPYRAVAGPIPAIPGMPPLPAADGTIRCAECGRSFPPDQLITLAGRPICAACKPVAVQKFQEGVVSYGRTADPEELWRMIRDRGYDFTIGSILARAWALVKGNFWPCLGVTLLCYLIMMGASQIPCVGLLAGILVQPQIMAGVYWYFLRQFRGQEATLNDSFEGFRRGYWQQALYMLIIWAISFVCMLPLVFLIVFLNVALKTPESTFLWIMAGLMVVLMPLMWYLMIGWIFAPILILDKGLDGLPAMKLSWRVAHLHIWKILGLSLVLFLLAFAGFLALIVGLLVYLPIFFATIARLYEDIFGEEGAKTSA